MTDTLWHINWGDGDNCYTVAPDKETAISRMPHGRDMVNYVVQLDHLYQMIYKAGQRGAIKVYTPYVKALEDENGSLIGFAHTHGWRSSGVEFGKRCREKIKELKKVASLSQERGAK